MSIADVTVTLEVAFGNGPLDDPLSWTDISADMRSLEFTRGRHYELDRINAGIMTVTLSNGSGNYNAHNTAGAYYPNVKPMTPIRVIATFDGNDYPLWQGFVERWPVSFPAQVDSIVTVQCVDLFKLLSLARTAPNRPTAVDALNPVAWWRMADETDEVGGHDLTFAGSPTEGGEAGPWEGDVATAFDGTNDAATVANEGDVERLNTDRSYEFWVNPSSGGSGTDVLFDVRVDVSLATVNVRYNHATDQFTVIGFSSSISFSATAGEWHHVVISDDFATDIRTVYLNGVNAGTAGLITESGTPAVAIGQFGPAVGGSFFQGDISEIAVYPTALTTQEVQGLYNAQFETLDTERTDERIASFLADFGYASTDLEVGQTTMSGPNSPIPESILEGIQTATETENGTFFMTGDGVARFHDRHYRIVDQETPVETFTGTDYLSVVLGYDDERIFNQIEVTTSDDTIFTANDAESVSDYGHRTFQRTIYPNDPNEGYDAAHDLLARYKEADTRIEAISFRLKPGMDIIATLLAAELGNRYAVQVELAGDNLDEEVYLEAISMAFSAEKIWDITWQLSPASVGTFWLMGVAGFSEIGETTILGY